VEVLFSVSHKDLCKHLTLVRITFNMYQLVDINMVH